MNATLTTLAGFSGPDLLSSDAVNGAHPFGDLIADAKGDLFGTTSDGGANGPLGTVFEIVKTAGGYASTSTTLVSFNDDDGSEPQAGLLADSNGDLFGTEFIGGPNGVGTVVEFLNTASELTASTLMLMG